jgi:toxin-antitoxin system PIN domain toxin
VIALDTNLLVYAHRSDSEWHDQASAVVRDLAEGSAPWAVPWPCLHEFLAIVTHPRIFLPPTPLESALDQVDAWLDSPTLLVLTEAAGHWTALRSQLIAGQVTGPKIHDARVAAVCVSHGVTELWSADRDFSRFPELKLRNPLIVRE